MKFYKLYICIVTVMLSSSSCDSFLDLDPISDATSTNAYNTASDAEAALVGVYDSFQAEYYIWDNVIFSDVMSDNYYAGGDNPEVFAVDNLDIEPVNGRLFSNWSQLYNAIFKANVVLDKVPMIEDPRIDLANRREQILGEAAFMRAYHYFQLVNLWGGVPLVLSPTSSTSPEVTNVPRSSVDEVYNQIISDLTFAIDERLPYTYGSDASVNKARATRGAALALLAKVYAQKPDRDYARVLQYADAVIDSPAGYSLLGDFNHLFDGNHYNNAESIMEIQFVGGPEANFGPQLLLPPSVSGDTWRKFVTPSRDLVSAFDQEGDVIRKNASILFESAPWVDEFWSLQVNGNVPFAFKWKEANGWASTNRQYLIRLADIILLKAEALNELGRTQEALLALNMIRSRVNLPAVTTTDGAELKLLIEKERRLELAQEAQRWMDLKRYGRAEEVMNSLIEIDLRTNQPKVFNMDAHKLILPIPQQEMNRNAQLNQNPGYN
ncbi:RagB/SusD family nutrient uptake outer membrane protein [Belliella sp. DSM 111904]|uniref:RagB/SusD family nutrient uptake outer membrane protein n=1 Tax=Belliella filtrata TaxID=2923435 RepID=A0ABS9UXB0_9BACT|nr:RagB/SusD family nutrient uptake outer membrane protein [Belliella filtrata]MCH7408811.1 RagB/SusD family nutrient uptake outer membrane protein [Belliella filtrata]